MNSEGNILDGRETGKLEEEAALNPKQANSGPHLSGFLRGLF
jgi:hypothetical protein